MNLGIKNYKELSEKLNKVLGKSMQKLTDNSSWIVQQYLKNYYDEFVPNKYHRTNQFYNALSQDDARENGGIWFSAVYMDYYEMYYMYYKEDETKSYFDDGFVVLQAADAGYHSAESFMEDVSDNNVTIGYQSKHRFWNDSVVDIWNDLVIKKFKNYIYIETGCPVKITNGYYMGYNR